MSALISEYCIDNRKLYKWAPFKKAWIMINENMPANRCLTIDDAISFHYKESRDAGRRHKLKQMRKNKK